MTTSAWYRHPSRSVADLLAGARSHPYEVLRNPTLDLLSLSDPAAYVQIRERATAELAERAKYDKERLDAAIERGRRRLNPGIQLGRKR